jgi:hypothetical protein
MRLLFFILRLNRDSGARMLPMPKRDFAAWRAAIGAVFAGLTTVGCASDTTDAAGSASLIKADTYVVTLPTASDWVCERVAADEEAVRNQSIVCVRQLRDDRMVMAAAGEEFSEEEATAHAGEPPAAVLAFIGEVEAKERRARGDEVIAFSSMAAEHVAERAGTACSGYRQETIDRQVRARTIIRSLICIDPRTRRPVRLTYLEEFPDVASQPRPAFETEANQFFEGLQFQ